MIDRTLGVTYLYLGCFVAGAVAATLFLRQFEQSRALQVVSAIVVFGLLLISSWLLLVVQTASISHFLFCASIALFGAYAGITLNDRDHIWVYLGGILLLAFLGALMLAYTGRPSHMSDAQADHDAPSVENRED